jgi:hypothetical protein
MSWKVLLCLFGNFCIDLYSVDSDEAMKRDDEALNTSSLPFLSSVERFIASSLRFFLSVKRFIAVNFYGKPSFNASSLLLFKRSSSFNASSPLLFKLTLPTSGCRRVSVRVSVQQCTIQYKVYNLIGVTTMEASPTRGTTALVY